MTPTEVWEGFDATKAPLETSIISTSSNGNIVHSIQAFTVESTPQSKLRAVIDVYFDDRWVDARGALLLLPSFMHSNYNDVISQFLGEGYVVCTLDYCGMNDGNKTTFPDNLAFASYPECLSHLDEITGGAHNTPWYVWSKIARRAITLLSSISTVEKNHIGIIGLGVGAKIAWQVAGIDKRVRALIAINGGGYRWAKDPRFTSSNLPSTDEQRAFSTGVGAETYARFITCPTLFVSSRSSKYNDVDRTADMIDLVKSNSKQMIITSASGDQMTKKEFSAILWWLRNNFALDATNCTTPTISFETAEGRLYVRTNAKNATKVKKLYVNYGEPSSLFRAWKAFDLEQKVGKHEYIIDLPVYDKNELIVAYATFEYTNGNIVSTRIAGAIPSKLDANIFTQPDLRNSKIIYDSSMDIETFTASTDTLLSDDDNICLKTGPFNIMGITSKNGNMFMCRDIHKMVSSNSTLHLDAYSQDETELIVSMYALPEMKQYTAYARLQGGEFWQRILLENTDFKSAEGRTLQGFETVKVISFEHPNGILLNNMIWL